jgi:hypothetical protein
MKSKRVDVFIVDLTLRVRKIPHAEREAYYEKAAVFS